MKHNDFFRKTFKQKALSIQLSVIGTEKVFEDIYHYEIGGKNCLHIYTSGNLFSDELYVQNTEKGLVCKRIFKNNTNIVLKIKELKAVISGLDCGGIAKDDYFYSVENARIYETHTFPLDYKRTENDAINSEYDIQANNRWADPGVVSERVNASPYQPFPAILIGNYKTDKGFVHGSLSQSVFFHNYVVGHKEEKAVLEIYSSFKALAYREIAPKEILTDEWYFGTVETTDDFNGLFDKYTAVLRDKLPNGNGRSDVNRHDLVWGSWNDGIYRNVTHDILVQEARAIKKYFPNVKWFQLDDGYAVHNKEKNDTIAHGIGVPYENDGIDYEKFPKGLKAYTDEIREIGLRPAIWIGGWCSTQSKIYNEHPEWFSNYEVRMKNSQPLDVSNSEAREYMCSAIDTLITEYGFDAIKHDFWSYPFEASDDLYQNKDKSGYEYRSWWLQQLRERVAKDGYMQTGCDIALGNPFLAEYFNNYRYGIDVCSGNWDYVKTTVMWGCACFATHTGDLFVPNSDAIGLLPDLTDRDFLTWINYVLITHSMVEISGRYSLPNLDESRLKVLQKATCNINNGQDVYFANFDYRKNGTALPEIMYAKTPHFTSERAETCIPLRTVAIFNFDEEEKEISFNAKSLGLPAANYLLTNVWTGEVAKYDSSFTEKLAPHESRLYSVSLARENSILDSNVKLTDIVKKGNCLEFNVGQSCRVELLAQGKVEKVFIGAKSVPFEINGNTITFSVDGKSTISIVFS